MPEARPLTAHCRLPLLHLYCLVGTTGAVNMGVLPSCSWHFYLLSHKAWKAMNLGMSSRVHSAGVGERWGAAAIIFFFLQSWHFYTTLSQLTAGASRTVEPWPHIIVGSIPGQTWSPCQNFGGWTFLLPGKPVFPGKEINTGALAVKMHPLPALPPNELPPKLIAPESIQAAAARLLPELPRCQKMRSAPTLHFPPLFKTFHCSARTCFVFFLFIFLSCQLGF